MSQEQIHREGVLRYRLEKVEEQVDMYWRQHAHVKWMQYGDRNTAFFHAACTERKRCNKFGRINKENGGWAEEEGEKKSFITNYFSELFSSSGNHDTHRLLDNVNAKVTAEMNEALMKEFTRVEVMEALKAIGNLKAPGPDGLPALFYKEFWGVVGDEVVTDVLNVLCGGPMPEKWNEGSPNERN
jgi:hypothetical protein